MRIFAHEIFGLIIHCGLVYPFRAIQITWCLSENSDRNNHQRNQTCPKHMRLSTQHSYVRAMCGPQHITATHWCRGSRDISDVWTSYKWCKNIVLSFTDFHNPEWVAEKIYIYILSYLHTSSASFGWHFAVEVVSLMCSFLGLQNVIQTQLKPHTHLLGWQRYVSSMYSTAGPDNHPELRVKPHTRAWRRSPCHCGNGKRDALKKCVCVWCG